MRRHRRAATLPVSFFNRPADVVARELLGALGRIGEDRDVMFETRVTAAHLDDATLTWRITTDNGHDTTALADTFATHAPVSRRADEREPLQSEPGAPVGGPLPARLHRLGGHGHAEFRAGGAA